MRHEPPNSPCLRTRGNLSGRHREARAIAAHIIHALRQRQRANNPARSPRLAHRLVREALAAFGHAQRVAAVMTQEFRSLVALEKAAERWLACRTDSEVTVRRSAHRAWDNTGGDAGLIAAADQVRDLSRAELSRRAALSRDVALASAAMSSKRGRDPATHAFLLLAMRELALSAADLVWIEALAAFKGTRVRSGPTWWEDPTKAADAWFAAEIAVLGKRARSEADDAAPDSGPPEASPPGNTGGTTGGAPDE